MKKKYEPIRQCIFEARNLDGPSEEYLDQTAPLIGYIIHGFNTLESALDEAICELFFPDDDQTTGQIVIYKLGFSSKLDLFRRFWLFRQEYFEKEAKVAFELIEMLRDIGNLRNTVVHADWESAHDDGYTLCRMKVHRERICHEYIQFSVESLEKILEKIDLCLEKYDEYEQVLE
ncbi:MAG: hypothetical protein ACTSYJ_12595 [Candidatus Thorarchaeota archaeon]